MIGLVGVVAFFVFYANWCDIGIDGWEAPRWKVWTAVAALAVVIGCFALYGPSTTRIIGAVPNEYEAREAAEEIAARLRPAESDASSPSEASAGNPATDEQNPSASPKEVSQ